MPHITLNSDEPGIRGLLRYRPEPGRPISELAEVLLRGPSTLTRGERELIAAYVSALNGCRYCSASHAASAAAQLPGGMALVEQVRVDAGAAQVPAKLKALLAIAAAVQHSGLSVTPGQVAAARAEGATDLEIHDTVLIAAAFCMMNRYVDGLATIAPADPAVYAAGAQRSPTARSTQAQSSTRTPGDSTDPRTSPPDTMTPLLTTLLTARPCRPASPSSKTNLAGGCGGTWVRIGHCSLYRLNAGCGAHRSMCAAK